MTEYQAFVGYNNRTGAGIAATGGGPMFYGYSSGDEFDWVYSDTFEPTESLEEKCELLYDRLNTANLGLLRTMSVGDCVVFVRQSEIGRAHV